MVAQVLAPVKDVVLPLELPGLLRVPYLPTGRDCAVPLPHKHVVQPLEEQGPPPLLPLKVRAA